MGPSIIDETVLAEPHNVSGGTPTCAPRDGLGLVGSAEPAVADGSARADSSGPELGFSKKTAKDLVYLEFLAGRATTLYVVLLSIN